MSCNCHEEYGDTIEVRYNKGNDSYSLIKTDAHGELIRDISGISAKNIAQRIIDVQETLS